MSGKKEKVLRKLAREELKKRMQPNGQSQQQRQINIIASLEQFVSNYEMLTGEKPLSITLLDPLYNLYIQTAQQNAEALGLNPGFRTEEPTFMGVKLVKKSPIVIPEGATPPPTPPVN